ncbi:hypothetical protein AMTRI_Chr03g45960 [Amborella trichopoda]
MENKVMAVLLVSLIVMVMAGEGSAFCIHRCYNECTVQMVYSIVGCIDNLKNVLHQNYML